MTQDYDSVVTTAALSPSSPPPLPDRLEKSPAVGEWLLKTGLSAR